MPTLPSGTVTFLFSDIEGSTRLLQHLGPHYITALEDHRRLLRAAWDAHSGVEVDTQGDSFFVAFSRAEDALVAAVEATRALAHYTGPEGTSLAVRIGLHTGTPAISNNQYAGLDVHRAARIAAAGYGGQVLLSQTTRDLCEDRLPEDVSLLDLGEARLKDLQYPEHIYQIALPDVPHDFPPLKTLDRVPNNLPVQPTPFLGRQEVIQSLVDLLEQSDVHALTLLGPGGIGKTRVALEVAAHVTDRFPDGVYFVSLSPLTDPSLVAGTIARALGLREGGGATAEEHLHAALGRQRELLVIDNFEPVIAAAGVCGRLTAACPGVKTLVTSRIALRLRGEHEFTIPPLETPDSPAWTAPGKTKRAGNVNELSKYAAVELFVERAREVKPDFTLTPANAPAVAEICRRLDGLPLAIELAAARLKMLSPQAILSRLSKRLDLLTNGPRDQPERQQTMRATITWSYDQLRPDEQAVFRRMTVFSGGWTLEAAEAVCEPTLDAFAGLNALIDQSLINQREESDGEFRFWQLETIRAFAADEFETYAEVEDVRAAHARYFLALAERTQREARGPDAQIWLERLERELDNFRTALAWARDTGELTLGLRLGTALSGFWYSHGHEREGARWLLELLQLAEPHVAEGADADDALRAVYAWGLGRAGALLVYLADYERATSLLERGLAAERALGDRDRELRTLNMLGVAAQLRGDHEAAARWHEDGLRIARAAGLDDLASVFLNNLGDLAYYQGDLEGAAARYGERLAYAERSGDRAGVVVGRQNIGRTLLRQGQIDLADLSLRRSLAGAWRLRDPRRIAEGLEGLAALAGARGEAEQSARLLGAATQLRETLGTPQPEPERLDIEAAVEGVRASLGAEAWESAFLDGREQAIDQVIADALQDVNDE